MKCHDYDEFDAQIYSYCNTLGKFCGRNSSDAQISSTPFALSKVFLRKENEMYTKLKNRVHNNTWGSKSVLRSTWIQTLKDEGYNFEIVKTCLLSLEEGINDLVDIMYMEINEKSFVSTSNENSNIENLDLEDLSNRLFNDPSFRSELELESIGQQKITSLWSSPKVRNVFRAITKSAADTGVLALCLDILSRNCFAFIDANTVKKSSRSTKGRVVDEYYYVDEFNQPYSALNGIRRSSSRRRNSSRQQEEGFYTDFF